MPEMNYDPNLTTCGRMATQTVRLTFGMWEYRKTMEVEVGGNCTGLTVIDCAVGIAYEQLEQLGMLGTSETTAVIIMESLADPEETLECSECNDASERLRGEDWLKDMLVSAEIIAIRPA